MIKKRARKANAVDIEVIAETGDKEPETLDEGLDAPDSREPESGKQKLQKEAEQHTSSHYIKVTTNSADDLLNKRHNMGTKYFDTIAAVKMNRIKKHFKNPVDVDYNPSICKDFHDSGYCSWGDSCIYAHDRTNYKRGWEIDKEWEDQQKELKSKQIEAFLNKRAEDGNRSDKKEDECQICHNSAIDPVYTECEHLFCEKCILEHYKHSKKCPECAKPIKGVFTDAKLKRDHPAKLAAKPN